jgi:hypothetical protein
MRPRRGPAGPRSTWLAMFLAGAPVAAWAAGSWAYSTSIREGQVQQTTLHQVRATLLTASTQWNFSPDESQATARWRAPDGQERTGQISLAHPAPAGSTVMVWINQSGQLTNPPLQSDQAVSRAELSGALAVVGLAITLVAVGWLVHRALDRRRLAAWDADWRATGPRWSSRR